MGTVLEMKQTIAAVTVLLMVAGCSGSTTSPTNSAENGAAGDRVMSIISQTRQVLGGISSDSGAVSVSRSVPGGFSPEAIAAEPGAYRLVQINALGLAEPARVIQENGDEVTLAFQSGPTAAFDGGVLVATRGFGDDLLTIDSQGVLEALRAGGGSVSRRMETLDAQDQIQTQTFACTIAAVGRENVQLGLREVSLRRFNENCRSEALVVDNIYWLDEAGEIVSSRQFVSPSIAYLRANAL